MNTFTKTTWAMMGACLPVLSFGAKKNAPKPNVIIVICDDLGLRDVGFNGAKDIVTPNIDRIAQEGVHCTNAYVSAPYSGPSRCGLFTGRYQQRFGGECNIDGHVKSVEEKWGVPQSEVMLTELMKQAGYQTGVIGKWHMGDHVDLKPNARGADYFYGFSYGSFNFWGFPDKNGHIEENNVEVPASKSTYLTDDFTTKSLEFIEDATQKDNPFFLYLSYNAPHAPMQAPQKYLDRTTHISNAWRSIYAAMILGVDDGLGQIWQMLEDKGIEDETMIIFLSDNGGTNLAMNYPQRAYKGNVYDGGTRVPFAVYYKDKLKGGKTYDKMISSLDIYPTVAALAGVTEFKNPLDGKDLMPYLKGKNKKEPHDQLFFRVVGGFEYAVRDNRYKLVHRYYQEEPFLYDMVQDPYEMTDIAAQHPELVHEMLTAYEVWNAQMIQPKWVDPHSKHQVMDYEAWTKTRQRALKPVKK